MATPEPIGPLYYDEARAVKIRHPGDMTAIHSAIHGGISVEVDNVTEGNAIIAAWQVVMQKAADEFQAVLDAIRAEAVTP